MKIRNTDGVDDTTFLSPAGRQQSQSLEQSPIGILMRIVHHKLGAKHESESSYRPSLSSTPNLQSPRVKTASLKIDMIVGEAGA